METHFKPASPHILSEIRGKKKRKENFITGEVTETVEKKEQLSHIRGEYCLELFDQDGQLVEKIAAENATPIIYSKFGTNRQLDDIGVLGKTGKHLWTACSYPKFFDEGFLFFTQENTTQTEHIQGAIPSGTVVGLSTIDKAYTGESSFAGTVNTSLSTVDAGHQVTTLTYVADFALEKANGTFDTVWLGHHTNNRYEQGFNEMKFRVGGHFKNVDVLSPTLKELLNDYTFPTNQYPVFLPLDGYRFWGQNYKQDDNSQGYYFYDYEPDSNEVNVQKISVLNEEFNSCEAGGPAVYKGKPAVMKRKPVSTNLYELVYFDLIKDSTFQMVNPQIIKLSAASLPNHEDLRLMHIKSFDDALYAIFKPVESDWGRPATIYCVKYSNDGSTYYGHTTFTADSSNFSQDKHLTQSAVDVYRINNVDYFVIAYDPGMNHQYAIPYYVALTNENKVVDKSKMNAFSEAVGQNQTVWRQIEPNGLFFTQSGFSQDSLLKLVALMPPFSHTKIQTTVKDASQSMRLTYTVKIYHNISQQFLLPKSSLEEKNLLTEEAEEKNSIFSKIKEIFS